MSNKPMTKEQEELNKIKAKIAIAKVMIQDQPKKSFYWKQVKKDLEHTLKKLNQ